MGGQAGPILAAKVLGITLEDYLAYRAAGKKLCRVCRQLLHPSMFSINTGTCKPCRRHAQKRRELRLGRRRQRRREASENRRDKGPDFHGRVNPPTTPLEGRPGSPERIASLASRAGRNEDLFAQEVTL